MITTQTNEKMRFSASRLDTWMTCPLQARFQYLDRKPRTQNAAASFGSCIHHALDHYNHAKDLESALAVFIDVWDNPEKLNVTPDTWPKGTSYGTYRMRGLEVIRAYDEKLKWGGRSVLATEHHFVVPFGDYELHGFVDLVELRKGAKGKQELRIIDYKTNKRQPNLTALKLNIQFTVYHYAAMQPEFWFGTDETPAIPDAENYWPLVQNLEPRTIWYHLETNKEIYAGPRTDKDFMRLMRACMEVEKALANDVFVPNISGDSCLWCPYTEPCGVEIVKPEDWDE